ncbi:MAG: hypothetical protein ACE1ZA_18405 [Pseudomonadales bacterium]
MTHAQRGASIVRVALPLWLGIAVVLGASGRIETLQPPAPQLVLVALTAGTLAALWLVQSLRAWVQVVDVRWLVGFHLTRFVGVYFLLLYRQGELPYAFAVPGGWGDIVVAALAMVLIATGPPHGSRRRIFLAWNVLGLIDILFVVATATRLAFANPLSMAALLRFPLSLLPTFVVPLVIAIHVVLFVRLTKPSDEPRAAAGEAT